ncbi:hypothetical protein C5745_12425 [Sphingobacterium haloxyli]|uniref:Uncharacterized protein n=2 Tax=Sphingobacterium haloxyli TaxID=2100533 RepID=A0A2S9J379_9SPHI|nr:hypothetical protein C5745_12425 [Sphingobacterium haloxyli]
MEVITDQSGTRLLLGAHKEKGGLRILFGENNRPTFSVNMSVALDSDGNFKEVTSGKKTYSLDASFPEVYYYQNGKGHGYL